MEARPYRRRPRSYVLALVFGGAAFALLAFGLFLDALPEEGSLEWNGLPLGEYGTTEFLPTIIPLAFVALIFAAVALGHGRALQRWQRGLLVAILAAAGVGMVLTLLSIAFVWAYCHDGCN